MRYMPDYENERFYLRCDIREIKLLKELLQDKILRESNLRVIQTAVHLFDKIEEEIEDKEKELRKEYEQKHKHDKKKDTEAKFPDVLDPGFFVDSETQDDDNCSCFEKEND